MLRVQSIFRSLDGEANGYENSGQPCCFIRLRGCNLRCKWCLGGTSKIRIIQKDHTIVSIPVKDIEPGMEVLSYDFDSSQLVSSVVVNKFSREVDREEMIRLEFESGTPLFVTKEHPFFVGEEWVLAGNLKVGDEIFSIPKYPCRESSKKEIRDLASSFILNGRKIVKISPLSGRQAARIGMGRRGRSYTSKVTVYNFECEGQHNYFVEGLLSHNCDTSYAQEKEVDLGHGIGLMSVDKIISKVFGDKVTITGGESLWQGGEVATLISRLIQRRKEVSVETNGSIPLTNFGLCYLPRNKNTEHGSVRFVLDYKLPSSGMEQHMVMDQNTRVLQPEDVVKFVVADEIDLDRMNQVYIERWGNQGCKAKIAISPAISITSQGPDLCWAATLAEKVMFLSLKMGHPIQYSLQVHKILWPKANEKDER